MKYIVYKLRALIADIYSHNKTLLYPMATTSYAEGQMKL